MSNMRHMSHMRHMSNLRCDWLPSLLPPPAKPLLPNTSVSVANSVPLGAMQALNKCWRVRARGLQRVSRVKHASHVTHTSHVTYASHVTHTSHVTYASHVTHTSHHLKVRALIADDFGRARGAAPPPPSSPPFKNLFASSISLSGRNSCVHCSCFRLQCLASPAAEREEEEEEEEDVCTCTGILWREAGRMSREEEEGEWGVGARTRGGEVNEAGALMVRWGMSEKV